ncbi:hypothetical protein J6590_043665 [Homalodisca vitripennis]|nr:hypothetical protein J6590_043665 [Homalodisca vitripennis]
MVAYSKSSKLKGNLFGSDFLPVRTGVPQGSVLGPLTRDSGVRLPTLLYPCIINQTHINVEHIAHVCVAQHTWGISKLPLHYITQPVLPCGRPSIAELLVANFHNKPSHINVEHIAHVCVAQHTWGITKLPLHYITQPVLPCGRPSIAELLVANFHNKPSHINVEHIAHSVLLNTRGESVNYRCITLYSLYCRAVGLVLRNY